MNRRQVEIRRFPYTYRAMLAICSEFKKTFDRSVFSLRIVSIPPPSPGEHMKSISVHYTIGVSRNDSRITIPRWQVHGV